MNSREIEAAADAWLHRKDLGPWDAAAQAAFECWLEECPRHRVAYLRLEHAWERAERLKALRRPGGQLPARAVPANPVHAPETDSANPTVDMVPSPVDESRLVASAADRPARGRRLLGWSAAAASIAAVGLVATLWWNRPQGVTYATTVGAVESVPITDGSTITLNTASQVRVVLSKDIRNIDLERGEALFEVAHDPRRPFVVHAGHQRVIAVGTKFSVRREGEHIRVVVTEGKVRIEADRALTGADVSPQFASADTVARAGDNNIVVTPVSPGTAEESLSWRQGILIFHDMTLAQAAAELNRYNTVQVAIEDQVTANLLIAGEVRSTNVDTFVRMVEQGYHLYAERSEGRIVLRSSAP